MKDEALKLALEALESTGENDGYHGVTQYFDETMVDQAITAIKAALEAKDEPANDELLRLRDLLGKANALARIRANEIESLKASLYGLYELEKQRDELEQRLTKTEAQLGEAMWNYGELKREQLANQQKTSGSPINTSAALEAKDEPVATDWERIARVQNAKLMAMLDEAGGFEKLCEVMDKYEALSPTPSQRTWVGLTNEEVNEFAAGCHLGNSVQGAIYKAEAKLKEKNT